MKTGIIKTGILGASGFVGAELLRFLAGHSAIDVEYVGANTTAGKSLSDVYPHLAIHYPNLKFESLDEIPSGLDLLFLALPHGEAGEQVKKMAAEINAEKTDKKDVEISNGKTHIIDLTADFRLDPTQYEQTYGLEHPVPDLQKSFAVGIPEFFTSELANSKLVSVPGCYTTATVLALKPLIDGGLVAKDKKIIVDAASGVSGAGKSPTETTTFNNVDENFFAYKLSSNKFGPHRHTPEMEQYLGADAVLFTPHLAPMNRGILATCYGESAKNVNTPDLLACYKKAYKNSPFIQVLDEESPATKHTLGTNAAQLHSFYDEKTKTVVALAAIDNLGKGAAGQAIQCANLMFGLDEKEGLGSVGLYP